jgi:hypothetical protein
MLAVAAHTADRPLERWATATCCPAERWSMHAAAEELAVTDGGSAQQWASDGFCQTDSALGRRRGVGAGTVDPCPGWDRSRPKQAQRQLAGGFAASSGD